MAQDQTLVLHGPFTATFDDGNLGVAEVITGSNKEAIEVNLVTKVATEELTDGAEIYDEAGRTLEANITIDEVVAADLDAIKTLFKENDDEPHSLAVQFTNMPDDNDILTLTADLAPAQSRPLFVSVDITGLKPVIKVRQAAPAGATIANLIAMSGSGV